MAYRYEVTKFNKPLFYSKASFKEQQLDQMMMKKPVSAFPTESNFFLTTSQSNTMGYTATRDVENFYEDLMYRHDDLVPYLSKDFNVTHVYRPTRSLKLFNLMDIENIKALLFYDVNSPFHISKKDIVINPDNQQPYDNVKAPGQRVKLRQFFEEISEKGSKFNPTVLKPETANKHTWSPDKFGGFIMLVASTNYHKLENPLSHETRGRLERYSSYNHDYIFAKIFKDYLSVRGFDGWWQPKGHGLHEEVMIFDPIGSIEPDVNHPRSWTANIPSLNKFKIHVDLLSGWRQSTGSKLTERLTTERSKLNDLKLNGVDSVSYKEYTADGYEASLDQVITAIESDISSLEEKISKFDHINRNNNNVIKQYIRKLDSTFKPYHTIQSYVNKTTGMNILYKDVRGISFESKECQASLTALVEEMRKYVNKPSNHHVGTSVADHSIWVTRCLYNWLGYKNHPWTVGIQPEFRNVSLLSGFLHDIGKIGDNNDVLKDKGEKRDHPLKGYLYVTKKLQYYSEDKTNLLEKLVSSCTVSDEDKTIIAVVIALHHHLGELLMSFFHFPFINAIGYYGGSMNIPHIMSKETSGILQRGAKINTQSRLIRLVNQIAETKYCLFVFDFLRYLRTTDVGGNIYNNPIYAKQVLMVLLAVSAADVYGAHPVDVNDNHSIYQQGLENLLDPDAVINALTNTNTDTIYGHERPYYKYLYYTFGLVERKMLLDYFDTIENYDNFVDAWTGFSSMVAFLNNPKKRRLPHIYHYLDKSSNVAWATSLLRLLKSGKIDEGNVPFPTVPTREMAEYFLTVLDDDSDELKADSRKSGIIGMFKNHMHPNLTKDGIELINRRDGIVPIMNKIKSHQAPF